MNAKLEKRQEKQKSIILEFLEKNGIIEVACKKADISRATYYRWVEDDVEFANATQAAIENGIESINDLACSKLLTAINNGNISAVQFWLRKRHPRFKDKPETTDRQVVAEHKFTAEEEEKLAQVLKIAELITKGEND